MNAKRSNRGRLTLPTKGLTPGALDGRLARLRAVLAEMISSGAEFDDCQRQQGLIADLEAAQVRERARQSRQRVRAAIGGKHDRFMTLAGRSVHLTGWHERVVMAWRQVDNLAAGGAIDLGVPGPVGRGDDWTTAKRTTGPDGRKLEAPATFRPKRVKDIRRVSDGGMARRVDAVAARRRARAAYAEAIGPLFPDWTDLEVSALIRGGMLVILSNMTAWESVKGRIVGRRSVVVERLNISMAHGISAVGEVLRIDQSGLG